MSFFTPRPLLRSAVAGLMLVCAAASAQAQGQPPAPPTTSYPHSSVGITLGYGAPYGWGVDFSHLLTRQLDASVGLGVSITGAKVAIGTRYYFAPARQVSPFVGASLAYSSGLNNVTVRANRSNSGSPYAPAGEETVVNFKATPLAHVRGGVRWQATDRLGLLGAVGYGFVLGGHPVEYVSGSTSQSMLDIVDIFSPGGIEVSFGLALGVGPSK